MNLISQERGRKQGVTSRRSFVDCRFGQLHLRTAQPNAQTSQLPLLCFHQSPSSGHIFKEFMRQMAQDRVVYAPDTPGFGESDPPLAPPEISDYAATMGELLDELGHPQVDLLGYHTGGLIASELAIERPQQVRRVILIGLAVFEAAEQEQFAAQPWPKPLKEDGSHLLEEWQRSMRWRGEGQTLEVLARNFVQKLRAGDKAWWGARAAINYPAQERFPLITQPVLAVRPKDDLWEISLRAKPLLGSAKWLDFPQYGFNLFDVAAGEVATVARATLAACGG